MPDKKTMPLWDFLRQKGEELLREQGAEAFAMVPESEEGKRDFCAAFCASYVDHAVLYQREDGYWGVDIAFNADAVAAGAPPAIGTSQRHRLTTRESAIEMGVNMAASLLANEEKAPPGVARH